MHPAEPGTRPTLNEVARHAGVSRATASLVLRDSPLVAVETRARVAAAVAALGYVYNREAATLRSRRTKTVGLLVTEIQNPFFGEVALGVDAVADAADYVVFLASVGESVERQDRFLRRMREQKVDGMLICPAAGTPGDLVARLREWRMPCVQTQRFVSAQEGDYAGPDYDLGIQQAAEHLIRLGHRRIAFVGGDLSHSASRARWSGFAAALRRHGLAPDLVLKAPPTRRTGVEAVPALLARPDAPTAALCFNDLVAFGMMAGLRRRGLRPGRDFAIVGVDDIPEAELSEPALTTVATLPRQVGEEAARLLLRRIADPGGAQERIIMPARLIVRESCGAAFARQGAEPEEAP